MTLGPLAADAYAQMVHACFVTQKQAALHVLTFSAEHRTLCTELQLKKMSDSMGPFVSSSSIRCPGDALTKNKVGHGSKSFERSFDAMKFS